MNRSTLLPLLVGLGLFWADSGPVLALEGDMANRLEIRLMEVPKSVRLGKMIEFKVELHNTGEKPVNIRDLKHDIQSIYFHIVTDTENFYYHRIHHTGRRRTVYKPVSVIPGTPLVKTFEIPTYRTGTIEITAKYNGYGSSQRPLPDTISSPSARVRVTSPEIEKDVVEAVVQTNQGTFTMQFHSTDAPNSVANFLWLASSNYYNRTEFHRVVQNYIIQGGDPDGSGRGGPGYTIMDEISRTHTRGAVGVARGRRPHSGGSQFYICLEAQPDLDKGYTVFGQVVDGMDVIEAIGDVEVDNNERPKEKINVEKVTIQPGKSRL